MIRFLLSRLGVLAMIGLVLFIAVLAFATPLSSWLGASAVRPDISQSLSPLVRHQVSQLHCYDNGSQFCESQKNPSFEKEFTLGYTVPHVKAGTKGFIGLFSCLNKATGRYSVDTDRFACQRAVGNRSAPVASLGIIFKEPVLEASAPLYRCFGPDGTDALLTEDSRECEAVGYGKASLLGYMASAGYLPQRRLEEMCVVAQAECAATKRTAVCNAVASHCRLSPTTSPSPAPATPRP